MRLIALLLVAAAFSVQTQAAPSRLPVQRSSCNTGSAKPVTDPRMLEAVANAKKQHALFGGQVIDRSGAIVTVGFHEAEFDRLSGEGTPTWKRVAEFWTTLDEELPSSFRSPEGALVSSKRLLDQIAANSETNAASRLDTRQLSAVETAFLRNALVDHPWSAVFISFLMKTGGFTRDEFAFSDSHVDYVDEAIQASSAEARGESTAYAFRACDAATTKPRQGDLICYTRARAAAIGTHAGLLERLGMRRSLGSADAIPMHCDLVTRADENGDSKMETIGGNVFQSVTLRRMTLNAGKTLSAKYLTSGPAPGCARDGFCPGNLSRKPWVVLLQFRH